MLEISTGFTLIKCFRQAVVLCGYIYTELNRISTIQQQAIVSIAKEQSQAVLNVIDNVMRNRSFSFMNLSCLSVVA